MAGLKERIKKLGLFALALPVMLLLTLFLVLLRGQGNLKVDEKALFPRWDSSSITRIVQKNASWELVRIDLGGEAVWRLHDQDGGSWPVDEQALEYLLELPGALKEHPLFSQEEENPPLSQSDFSDSWEFYSEDKMYLLQLQPTLDEGFVFWWDQDIYGSDYRAPDNHLGSYLALSPLKDLSLTAVRTVNLYTPLEGAASGQFRYQLDLEPEGWLLNPGGKEVDPQVLSLYLQEIQDLRAVSLLRSQDWELGKIRFVWTLADKDNHRWVLRLGQAIQNGGDTFWPVEKEGEPWIYLFLQEDLKKLAPPADSFLPAAED